MVILHEERKIVVEYTSLYKLKLRILMIKDHIYKWDCSGSMYFAKS